MDSVINDLSAERFKIRINLRPNAKPTVGDVGLGDIIDLKLVAGEYINFEKSARIEELAVVVDNNGAEFLTPTLRIV